MPPTAPHHPTSQEPDAMSLSRLINISDGVFAVAMTFLAFTVRLPAAAPDGSRLPLHQSLSQMLPQLYTLTIAFVAAARFWLIHYRMFARLKRADYSVTVINLFALLALVFLPITGDFIGVYPTEPLAVAIFAANMATVGILNSVIWLVAARHHLILDRIAPIEIRRGHWLGALSTAVFVLSIPVCWLNVHAAKAMWLTVILFILFQRSVEARRHPGPDAA
jgi:uncharacterized membrane protein